MDDTDALAMIALLPVVTDWCKIKLPHLTLVFAGETADLGDRAFGELAKDASALAQQYAPLLLHSTGIEVFGGHGYDEQVDVITFESTTQLLAMRQFVERWNRSEHPFNPHTTIGPAGSAGGFPPPALAFDRIYVGWGAESLTFRLKT